MPLPNWRRTAHVVTSGTPGGSPLHRCAAVDDRSGVMHPASVATRVYNLNCTAAPALARLRPAGWGSESLRKDACRWCPGASHCTGPRRPGPHWQPPPPPPARQLECARGCFPFLGTLRLCRLSGSRAGLPSRGRGHCQWRHGRRAARFAISRALRQCSLRVTSVHSGEARFKPVGTSPSCRGCAWAASG
jgi:hypothetical protein